MTMKGENWVVPGLGAGQWCWPGRIPAPELVGETLSPPVFDAAGHAAWGDLHLECRREVTAHGWTLQLTLRNNRTTPVELVALPLWESVGDAPSDVWQGGFEHALVYRLARQKNDMPGEFHPGRVDAALRNAAFDSSEMIAGGGIAWCEMEAADAVLPLTFQADPGMVLSDDAGSFAVFLGLAGQTRHLSRVAITTDAARRRLTRLAVTAEGDRIVLKPGDSFNSHQLVCESRLGTAELLERHAERIAATAGARPGKPLSVFCTWYYYGADIDRSEVDGNLERIAAWRLPFDVFQIDMGWEDRFGDWSAHPEKFATGMAATAAAIRRGNMIPGIWTAPFVIEPEAAAVRETPEMLLRRRDGECCRFQCAKGACYVIDPTHPAGEAYLEKLFRRLTDWGFGYHKLDFLRAMLIDRDAVFHDRGATRAMAYRRGLAAIRRAVGETGWINCCGGLYEGSAGLADAVRSGFDLRGHWAAEGSEISAYNNRIKQNLARSFYRRLWLVDPDALQIRRNTASWRDNPENAHLSRGVFTEDEAFSILVNQYLGGGLVCVSERFAALDADRLMLLRKILPNYSRRFVPLAEHTGGSEWLPSRLRADFSDHPALPPWTMVVAANWDGEESREVPVPLEVAGMADGVGIAVWDFARQELLGCYHSGDEPTLTVPAHGCRLLRLTSLTGNGPILVGTDGNLSCGMELAAVCGRHAVLHRDFPAAVPVRCWFLEDGALGCAVVESRF